MGKEEIVARILSDAEAEAEEIVRAAEAHAQEIVTAAADRAAAERAEAEKEAEERTKRILDGKAAAARLEGGKIALAERRRVLREVYARALARLLALGSHDTLALASSLLERYAEEGDVIVPALNFPYESGLKALPVVAEKGLKVSSERADIGGGFLLRGKSCDKDLSYPALLAEDAEAHQAEIAEALFKH